MLKKIVIVLVIAVFVGISTIPIWTSKLADKAFFSPELQASPENLETAIKVKIVYDTKGAQLLCEKGVIYFPEAPQLAYFMYTAGFCADREKNPDAAIYWYQRFVDKFPSHPWANQAQASLAKIKAMNDKE